MSLSVLVRDGVWVSSCLVVLRLCVRFLCAGVPDYIVVKVVSVVGLLGVSVSRCLVMVRELIVWVLVLSCMILS